MYHHDYISIHHSLLAMVHKFVFKHVQFMMGFYILNLIGITVIQRSAYKHLLFIQFVALINASPHVHVHVVYTRGFQNELLTKGCES